MIYPDNEPEGGRGLPMFAILFAMVAIVVTLTLMKQPHRQARIVIPGTSQRPEPGQITAAPPLAKRASYALEQA